MNRSVQHSELCADQDCVCGLEENLDYNLAVRPRRTKDDAAGLAFLIVMSVIATGCGLVFLAALIIAPFYGIWTPDIALGILLVPLAAWYLLYRVLRRKQCP